MEPHSSKKQDATDSTTRERVFYASTSLTCHSPGPISDNQSTIPFSIFTFVNHNRILGNHDLDNKLADLAKLIARYSCPPADRLSWFLVSTSFFSILLLFKPTFFLLPCLLTKASLTYCPFQCAISLLAIVENNIK